MDLTEDEIKVIEKLRKVKAQGYGEVVVKIKENHIAHSNYRIGENH